MKLQDIKGTYDAIYSLGDLCLGSIQLQQNNLRTFAGVLDWMGSPDLGRVNLLLKNRFSGFMDPTHLKIIGYAGDKYVCVMDEVYYAVSNHDYEIGPNSLYQLGSYAEVKAKYDRRIRRFLEKAASCERMLFVRTEGSREEAAELQTILSGLVRHDFNVLVINHTAAPGLIEEEWSLDKVCAVQLPALNKWTDNHHLWKKMFEDIYLVPGNSV